MKRNLLLLSLTLCISLLTMGQYDWDAIAIPADAGVDKEWQLQENLSDDFNYTASFSDEGWGQKENFGSGKWNNFYHDNWDGPGGTVWRTSQVSVDGDNLVITVAKNPTDKNGYTGVKSGCVTSNNRVSYPAYVESSLSVANISLASCFWLLSSDNTQEIDIIENYGSTPWFGSMTHISHHSFIRTPFTDYQPRDRNSWYTVSGISNWGEYCWNNGNRIYMRMGVYWKAPKHFEYYIDGNLVRVMYHNATATKISGTWQYQYFNNTYKDANNYTFPTNYESGTNKGYTEVTTHSVSTTYDFSKLEAASAASPNNICVIDPGNFQGGAGFTKNLDIIINMESQDWLAAQYTPSDTDLSDATKNQMKVDWVRVYKPVSVNQGEGSATGASVKVEAEDFINTSGSAYDDSGSGGPGYGVVDGGTVITHVNNSDWAEYTVNIPTGGDYQIKYSISAPGGQYADDPNIKLYIDGTPVSTDKVTITGGYNTFEEQIASMYATGLTAGNHTFKFEASGSEWQYNLDYFIFTQIIYSASNDINASNIEIYPNPTAGMLNITSDRNTPIELYNIVGSKVYQIKANAGTTSIDISDFGSGLYILKVGDYIERVIVD